MADASYPDELLYHPEHDWARIEGDEATFGITWYAQDTLGEVVFFDPPQVGAQVCIVYQPQMAIHRPRITRLSERKVVPLREFKPGRDDRRPWHGSRWMLTSWLCEERCENVTVASQPHADGRHSHSPTCTKAAAWARGLRGYSPLRWVPGP